MHCDWLHVFDFVGQLQWLGLRSCRFHVGAGAFGAWLCLWEITRVFGKNNLVPTVTSCRAGWGGWGYTEKGTRAQKGLGGGLVQYFANTSHGQIWTCDYIYLSFVYGVGRCTFYVVYLPPVPDRTGFISIYRKI